MADAKFTPCRDFPGYEVSACGRVRSVASDWRGYGTRELAQQPNADGYPSVRLTVCGRRKRLAVHRLVAAEYLPPKPEWADQLRHLDGNRANSRADNLAWGNASDNAQDRTRHGTYYRLPWDDPEFRQRMIAAQRAGHQRNRELGVGRYAK